MGISSSKFPHSNRCGRFGTLAALCRSPSLRAIGAAMPGVSNSVSPTPQHHDVTPGSEAEAELGSSIEVRPKLRWLVVGGGWVDRVGIFS